MPIQQTPDWQALLLDMRSSGMTQEQIAKAVGLSQASVSDILRGVVKRTEFSRGMRILAAHRVAMRRKSAKARGTEPSQAEA